MYYKVLLEIGHMGADKSKKSAFYFEAENMQVLLDDLKSYPALKIKEEGTGITFIKAVSRQEYEKGKVLEWKRTHIARNY